jgi:hypothetical protein
MRRSIMPLKVRKSAMTVSALAASVFVLRAVVANRQRRRFKGMGDPGLEPGASALSERRSNRLS